MTNRQYSGKLTVAKDVVSLVLGPYEKVLANTEREGE